MRKEKWAEKKKQRWGGLTLRHAPLSEHLKQASSFIDLSVCPLWTTSKLLSYEMIH